NAIAGSRPAGLLIEADHVARRVAKPRRDLGRIRADRLDDLSSLRDDAIERGGDAVDHDVEEHADLGRRLATRHPGSAHLAGGVVECEVTVATRPDLPAEDLRVEVG